MKLPLLILFLILLGLLGFSIPSFINSEKLKIDGDKLAAQGHYQEAYLVYKDAYDSFPVRGDLKDTISATKAIINSKEVYGQIVDQVYAEIQEIPEISNVPVILKTGELFVPILMYHHIRLNPRPQDRIWASLNVTTEQLNAQFNFLASNNFHTITLGELKEALDGKKTLPEKPIVLTFDDGYVTFYENAYPLLKKYKLKAIEFVITNEVSNNKAYLTWDQISEMDKSGLVEFGAHSQNHPNLPSLPASLIVKEINGSKKDLETRLGKQVNWFAYPYGSYNNFVVDTVVKAGFDGAVSTIYGPLQTKDKMFLLPRIMVDGRFTIDELARRIQK